MFDKNLAVIGLCLLGVGAACAQQEPAAAVPAGRDGEHGNPLKFGSVVFYPSAALRFGHDDNITLAPRNPTGSTTRVLRAGLLADYEQDGDRYLLGYDGTYNRYQSSSIDNVDNHQLTLQGNNFFTARHALSWQAIYQDGHDQRGSTDRDRVGGTVSADREPDHFTQWRIGGTYRYGAEGARGRIEVDAFQNAKQYRNNRDSTRTADVDSRELGFRFLYRIMPKTQLVFELRDANYDYRAANSGLDSTERRYLIGANWTATAATSGSLRVGRTVRDYREFRSGFSGLSWEAAINWKPLTYSRFDFTTSRGVTDPVSSLIQTNYVLTTAYGVKWTHDWKSHLRSELGWSQLRSDYDETGATQRKDRVNIYQFGVYYDFGRWMNLGLEFNQGRRDSNDPDFDYVQQRTMAVAEVKF